MLKQKRTKYSRARGSQTHGGGHMKKRRGAGNRGGVGNAGSGKGADSKHQKLTFKNPKYFGKHGFNSIHKRENIVLSLNYIEANFDKMVENEIIEKKGEEFIYDTTRDRYTKILGNTKFTKKLTLIVNQISKKAKESIEKNKGKVILKKSKVKEDKEE
jgi:large subunit ribosomal protein L15